MNEVVLASLDGNSPEQRVQVVLAQDDLGVSQFELRQQSWGDGVGWFTQNTLNLDPCQVSELKKFLGDSRSTSTIATTSRSANHHSRSLNPNRTCFASGFTPRLVDAG